MAVMIGNACADENGKYHGGQAGNQNGKELKRQSWYAYPGGWNTVVRAKDSNVAERIATAMENAVYNSCIGYDQYQRTTLFQQVSKIGWYPAAIRAVDTNCETDCSALVAVCVNCALGYAAVSKDIYTGNEAAALCNTGKFTALTESKYLSGSSYLKRGDILINTVHHTAIVLSNGANAETKATTTATASAREKEVAIVQTYKNGSTSEPVYQTTACATKIGELDPHETCVCYGKVDGKYLVSYGLGNSSYHKVGFVKYHGGTTF